MSFPLVISFFTQNTPYEEEAKELIASCEKFQLEHLVQSIPSFGSWELNCCFKPSFIHHVMEKLQRDVFWVDVDAVFVKKPTSFPLRCDLSLRKEGDMLLSGSIYVKYSKPSLKVLKLWIDECKEALLNEEEVWDQICLKKVLDKFPEMAKIASLPLGFCKIADLERDKIQKNDLYIVHHQASRLYKKWINGELVQFSEMKDLSSKDLKKLRGF